MYITLLRSRLDCVLIIGICASSAYLMLIIIVLNRAGRRSIIVHQRALGGVDTKCSSRAIAISIQPGGKLYPERTRAT